MNFSLKAQYYTQAQIQTIHANKQGAEGDLYLDTLNNHFYIGITTGELKVLGDKQGIDSIKILMPQRELAIYLSNGSGDTVQMDPSNDVWIDVNDNILAKNTQDQTLAGSRNIAFGEQSMANNTGSSSYKIAMGYHSGRYEQTIGNAYVNTIGYRSGYNNLGAKSNGFGYQTIYNNSGGVVNALGSFSAYNNTGDSLNAMGYQAGYNNSGSENLSIGNFSMRTLRGSASLINVIGYQAARFDSTNGLSYLNGIGTNVFYLNNGQYINALGRSTSYRNKGDYNNFIGTSSGQENSGDYASFYGYQSGFNNKGDYNLGFGMYTLRDIRQRANYVIGIGQYVMRLDSSINNAYNSLIGYYAGYQNKSKYFTGVGFRTGYNNRANRVTSFGPNALYSGKGLVIVALGNSAGYFNEGNYLVAFGHVAAQRNKGNQNVAIGMYAYRDVTNANYHVAIGQYASRLDSTIGDAYVNALGDNSGYRNKGNYLNSIGRRTAYNNIGSYTLAAGYQAAQNNTGDRLIAYGYQSGRNNKGTDNISLGTVNMNDIIGNGSLLTSIGHYASRYDSVNGVSESNVIGYYAGYRNAGAEINIIGGNSGYFNRKNRLNGFGFQAGYRNKGEENNAIGSYTLSDHIGNGNYINAIGYQASRYDSTVGDAYNNTLGVFSNYRNNGVYINSLGYQSGYRSNGNHHNLIGPYAQYDKAFNGNYNNAIGYQSLRIDSSQIGYINAIGVNSGFRNIGDSVILLGTRAGFNNKGVNVVGVGTNVLYNNRGSNNIAMGYQAGYRSTGNNNTYLGTNAGVYHEFGDSNIFIGNSSGLSSSFTRNNNLFVSNTYNSATLYANLEVKNVGINTISPDNNLSVNGTANKTGGGAWATFSDKRLKKNIKPYNTDINKLRYVNTVAYQYNNKLEEIIGVNKKTRDKIYEGVLAQDLIELFPDMVTEVAHGNETYLQVDPSNFTYILINTLKSQEEELALLEEQLQLLKSLANKKLNDNK